MADPNLKFWFPSMKPSEIVEAFANWGYSISPEQVARPTSEFVMGLYSACLEQVTGITLDSLQEAADQALVNTESPVRVPLSFVVLESVLTGIPGTVLAGTRT